MLQVGDIIEFCGTDESPKTEVLMSVIAQCILPKVVSGCEVDVIFISTDHKFNILTLVGVIEQKLKQSACNSDRTFLDSILDRFHLFQAPSISECCMVLRSLLHFPWMYGKIGAVVIDDVGTLSWENKMSTKKEPRLGDCVEMMKTFVQENEVLAILSHFSPLMNAGHHAKPWLRSVNYRFKVERCSEGANVRIQQIFPDTGKLYKFIHNEVLLS